MTTLPVVAVGVASADARNPIETIDLPPGAAQAVDGQLEHAAGEHPLARFAPNDWHQAVQQFAPRPPRGSGDDTLALAQHTPQWTQHDQSDPGVTLVQLFAFLAESLQFRADLSRVVSRYIGETETNLGAAFGDAQPGKTVLEYEESDSLLGKRP